MDYQDRGQIAIDVQKVLALLRNITASIEETTLQQEVEDLADLRLKFDNEAVRFRMWAGNLAAHQSGPASLDHRLREATYLQDQVIYLLRDIIESLEETVAVLSQSESQGDFSEVRDNPQLSTTSETLHAENSSTDSDTESEDGKVREPRLSTLHGDLSEAVDCLLRLSVAIANPVPHERFRKLGAGPDEDVSFFEEHDINYVRDKFPGAQDGLPKALGKFITRRRQFFKYREAHHARLAAGLDEEAQNDTNKTEIVPQTKASSIPGGLKDIPVIDEDRRSDIAMSETSYATSAGFLGQVGEQTKAPPLRVPPLPSQSEQQPFECPFCFRIIYAHNRESWKRHVFGDLRPYTCLFPGCVELHTDFNRRSEFQLHVSQHHWRAWSCPYKCNAEVTSASSLKDHVKLRHLPNADDEELSAVATLGVTPRPDNAKENCPICRVDVSGLKTYVKHVGRHLEQFSLFALPRTTDASSDNEVDSDDEAFQGSDRVSAPDATDSGELRNLASDEDHAVEAHSLAGEASPLVSPIHSELSRDQLPQPRLENIRRTSRSPSPMGQTRDSSRDTATILDERSSAESELPNSPKAQTSERPTAEDEQKRMEEEYLGRLRGDLVESGLDDETITTILANQKMPDLEEQIEDVEQTQDEHRPTWTRMSRRHISTETLRHFKVEYELDSDPQYILIKRWVPEAEQDQLWEHTRIIRKGRQTGDDHIPTYTRMSRRHLSIETLRHFDIEYTLDSDPEYLLIKRWVPEWEQDQLWEHTRIIREKRKSSSAAREAKGKEHSLPEPDPKDERVEQTRPDVVFEGGKSESPRLPRRAAAPLWPSTLQAAEQSCDDDEAALLERSSQAELATQAAATDTLSPEAESLAARADLAQAQDSRPKPDQAPITFKDAVGRKFSFPFHLCCTWTGMEELVKQAFMQITELAEPVKNGAYDLIGPDGEIILPSVWEKVIQPGMSITMTLWPIDAGPPRPLAGGSSTQLTPQNTMPERPTPSRPLRKKARQRKKERQ